MTVFSVMIPNHYRGRAILVINRPGVIKIKNQFISCKKGVGSDESKWILCKNYYDVLCNRKRNDALVSVRLQQKSEMSNISEISLAKLLALGSRRLCRHQSIKFCKQKNSFRTLVFK